MPAPIILPIDGCHSTGLVSCLLRSSTMTFGSVPGASGSAVAFMYTVQVGGFIEGSRSSRALPSLAWAGAILLVWKAPDVLISFACKAFSFCARSRRMVIAFSVPPQEKPRGKRSLAITHTASLPSFLAACAHSWVSLSFSRPAMEHIFCEPTDAASCMYWPRMLTSFSPSSKLNTPAAYSAVYSPSDRPAHAWKRVAWSGLVSLSDSMPAAPARNIAGWQYRVSSSFSSGPWRQRSSRSYPRMALALSHIALTLGLSFKLDIMFLYWEPWPGNIRPTGSFGGPACTAAGFGRAVVATAPGSTKSSSSPPSGTGPVPYFMGSKPASSAAPGRLEKKPFAGFFPHCQHW
mmetsp:Transcript_63861/g.195299  ORF Transcript_63861/g.195299 Transcript_63861/m.195299 type:complete len:348 (+) Transcript_63861:156-1199(+)